MMQPANLNMTTAVIGHQLFLFATFGDGKGSGQLAEAIDLLGKGMENMHEADGPPYDEAFERGRFQLLRAEAGLTSEQQIPHPEVSRSHGLIRLECASPEPIRRYETGLRALVESRGGSLETLVVVQRPRSYTSHAMVQFAYAHALAPGP